MKKKLLKTILNQIFLKHKLSKNHSEICSNYLIKAEVLEAKGELLRLSKRVQRVFEMVYGGFVIKSVDREFLAEIDEDIQGENIQESLSDENKLSGEIERLNNLLKDGILTQEEFEKAKKKLLYN